MYARSVAALMLICAAGTCTTRSENTGDSRDAAAGALANDETSDQGAVDGATSNRERADAAQGTDAMDEVTADALDDAGSNCGGQTAGPLPGAMARSAGFSGSDMAYFGLYTATCRNAGDCASDCVAAGGPMDSCTSGSACPAEGDGPNTCLPPTYWTRPGGALSQTGMATSDAEVILVDNPYDDPLVVTDFKLAVPADAVILGISFQVRHEADDGFAVDGAIRVLRGGAPVGMDRSQSGAWPMALAYATYGSATDTWGASWSPADVGAAGFGIAITPHYTGPTNGNDRAHIDAVTATVFYRVDCD